MVLELPWAKKRIFRLFEKGIIQFVANFWVMKLKPFSGKIRQSIQNYLNQNLVIGSFLENGSEATLSSKTNVLSVWKGHFSDFLNFRVRKLKPFPRKVKKDIKNYLNQNLVIESLLENCFEAILSSKTNVLPVSK